MVPMADQVRYEYHWENGILSQRAIRRPAGVSRWMPDRSSPTLVCVVSERAGDLIIRQGRASNGQLLERALVKFMHGPDVQYDVHVGPRIPEPLAEDVAVRMTDALDQTCAMIDSFGSEDAATGCLIGKWHEITARHGEWSVKISPFGFSSQAKEPVIGADFGIVFDVVYAGVRTLKSILVQSKMLRSGVIPEDPLDLPRLRQQMDLMAASTSDAFALVYSRQGAQMFEGRKAARVVMDEVFRSSIVCRRGDFAPRAIVNASHRKLVVGVEVSDGSRENARLELK